MAYSPEMVMLVQQLRTRVRAEFGVKIRLVDPELLSVLGDLGHKSRDGFTRKTIAEVMGMAGIRYKLQEEADTKSGNTAHGPDVTEITYRGQKIYKDANAGRSTGGVTAEARPAPSKQMYRGQVVNK